MTRGKGTYGSPALYHTHVPHDTHVSRRPWAKNFKEVFREQDDGGEVELMTGDDRRTDNCNNGDDDYNGMASVIFLMFCAITVTKITVIIITIMREEVTKWINTKW